MTGPYAEDLSYARFAHGANSKDVGCCTCTLGNFQYNRLSRESTYVVGAFLRGCGDKKGMVLYGSRI